jgi:hypothetical protein
MLEKITDLLSKAVKAERAYSGSGEWHDDWRIVDLQATSYRILGLFNIVTTHQSQKARDPNTLKTYRGPSFDRTFYTEKIFKWYCERNQVALNETSC